MDFELFYDLANTWKEALSVVSMVVIIDKDNLDLRWPQDSHLQWVFLSHYPNKENGAKLYSKWGKEAVI